ncbi:hypothetical protein CY34DRAFT_797953 [Suillus luteus UH-Slu-Lm8-n1]|uniref:Uncharacterized protein n=1 Tax=Suillus luteus UH-Slu-Lm8-n1 TaxID=930992 RepID=A0A0D0AEZ3_9AGAM|nr:hypothetical protein CY34DRAFT_797953 [Suillus luteus UH-Slu-Lm8-n1]
MACNSGKAAVASLDAVSPPGDTAATGPAPLTCLVIDQSSRPRGTCMASLDSLPLLCHSRRAKWHLFYEFVGKLCKEALLSSSL